MRTQLEELKKELLDMRFDAGVNGLDEFKNALNQVINRIDSKLKKQEDVILESEKPTVVEVFNDDGTHSHYALVSSTTGEKLWSENPIECKAQGYPVKQN